MKWASRVAVSSVAHCDALQSIPLCLERLDADAAGYLRHLRCTFLKVPCLKWD